MAETIKIGGELESTATGNVVAAASAIKDKVKNKYQSVINAENDIQLASHESRLNAYTEGKFVTVNTYSALPATGAADTVYRVSSWDGTANNGQGAVDVTKYSEYAWQNGAYKFLDVKTQIGEVFDISEYNSGAVYTDLANALGTNGTNVPSSIRRGGMSVKFKQVITPATYTVVKTEGATEQPTGTEIQSDPGIISGTYTAGELSVFSTLPATLNSSLTYYLAVTEQEVTTYTTWVITYVHTSDNKYAQYRLMKNQFSTIVADWQGVDDEPTTGSDNLVKSGGVELVERNMQFSIDENTEGIGDRSQEGTEYVDKTPSDFTTGALQDVDGKLRVYSTNNYKYYYINVKPGYIYKVKTAVTTSNNYPYYVFAVDDALNIIEKYIEKGTSNAYKTEDITVPANATRLFVLTNNSVTYSDIFTKKLIYTSLQSQIKSLKLGRIGYVLPIEGKFNFVTSTDTLEIASKFNVVFSNYNKRFNRDGSQSSIEFTYTGIREILLIFNTSIGLFSILPHNTGSVSTLTENDIIVGILDTNSNNRVFNFDYTINGSKESVSKIGFIAGFSKFNFAKTGNNIYTLYPPSKFVIYFNGKGIRVNYSEGNVVIQNQGNREQLVLFNISSNTITTINGGQNSRELSNTEVLIGIVDTTTGNYWFNFETLIEGKDVLREGDIETNTVGIKETANQSYGENLILNPFVDDYINSKYFPDEETKFNAFIDTIRSRQGNGIVQVAFITDTHEGGQYIEKDNMSAIRPVALYNLLAEEVDICMHGGDISCDYGTSVERYFAYMQEAIKRFKIPNGKNFLITKGNHDTKDNQYEEVSPFNVDWSNRTYYDDNFNIVTQQTYRGGGLYIKKDNLLSDNLFRFIQSKSVPTDAVWGDGAYYYYDDADNKIRYIVANSFPVDDGGNDASDAEWGWFAETALDLSAKETPTDWLVIVLRHTQASTNENFISIATAFMSGGSVTIGETTVDYGNLNGGGVHLIHLHGHEHSSAGYSNMAGFLDIGFVNGCTNITNFGKPSNYFVYCISVDTNTGKMIIDCIERTTVVYDYINNIVELGIGKSIRMARSGLSSQSSATWVSSNDNIATVSGSGIVVGVSAGTVTITGTLNTKVVTYTLKVV